MKETAIVRLIGTAGILLIASRPATVRAQTVPTGVPSHQAPATPAAAPTEPVSPKRILGVIPNFTTTDDKDLGALTARHKFLLAYDQMFDVSAHFGNLFQTSIQQATSGQPHYDTDAFIKRFGASEADQVTSCLFIYGVLPAVLHTDPRYFRREDGSAASRTWYAVSRTFVTRNDAGVNVFNTAQLAGQLGQAGLSNLYYADQDRTMRGTFTNWATQLVYNSAFNVLKEFYPDLLAKLHRHPMTH
jgi:hypothetical protein